MNTTPNPNRGQSPPASPAASQPAPAVATDQTPPAPRRHIGILVIHGMGDENPYGPLDAFARGLYSHYGGPVHPAYTMKTEWKERGSDPAHHQKSWTQAQIRFEPAAASDPALPRLTVAEYYWSPATKGKMKDLAVLTWLIRTALEPFRYLSENLQVMEEAGETTTAGKKTRKGLFILWREFFRLACVYPLLLGSFLAVAGFLGYAEPLLRNFQAIVASPRTMVIGLLLAIRLLILLALAGYFWNYRSWMRYREPRDEAARTFDYWLFGLAIGLAASLFLLPIFAAHAWRSPHLPAPHLSGLGWLSHRLHGWFPARSSAWQSIVSWPPRLRYAWDWLLAYMGQLLFLTSPYSLLKFEIPVAELAIAALIRWFLINFLGDVAIYTNLNQRAGNFAVRAQILEECGHALTSLYMDVREEAIDAIAPGGRNATPDERRRSAEQLTADDFQIVIAAHSLGSVIAWDTVNDLFNRARIQAKAAGALEPPGQPADPPALNVCRHMRGLLTFGSPLNKTYYFFRDQSAARQLIRVQLVDQLHSFRLRAPTGALDHVQVFPVEQSPELLGLTRAFCWLNVWAEMDIFSGKLFFYDLPEDCQLRRNYKIPVFAHLSYWADEKMYKFFADRLLF